MAQQKFPFPMRDAVWSVHDGKCFHCGKKVEFSDFEIDHLLPESLLEKPEELAAALTKYGLQNSFDIKANANLAPSCSFCNSRKGDNLLEVGLFGILLAKIASKLTALETHLSKARTSLSVDKTVKTVSGAVDAGDYSIQQLIEGLAKAGHLHVQDGVVTIEKSSLLRFAQTGSSFNIQLLDGALPTDVMNYLESRKYLANSIFDKANWRRVSQFENVFSIAIRDKWRVVVSQAGTEVVVLSVSKKRSQKTSRYP